MNKNEYIAELEERLQCLPERERRAALNYYEEYFNEAGVQRERNTIDELGPPEKVAAQILSGAKGTQKAYTHHIMKRKGWIIAVALGLFFTCAAGSAFAFSMFSFTASEVTISEMETTWEFYEEYESLEKLDISVGVCAVNIVGDDMSGKVSLEGTNIEGTGFSIDYNNDKLTIKQKDRKGFSFDENNTPEFTLIIPLDLTLDKVDINNGVGAIRINNLEVEDISFSVGVGAISIDDLRAENIKIKGGVGTVFASNITAGKLDIKGGVGNTSVKDSHVDGKITINGGVGKITLDLLNQAKEYEWDVESGLGSVSLNGEKLSRDYKSSSSSSKYKIDIDTGIGSIAITTID